MTRTVMMPLSHFGLYDIASLGTLFTGIGFALLLVFAKQVSRAANLCLSTALAVTVLKNGGLIPFFLPVLGPLLYFYVRQLTFPSRKFQRKDLLHLSLLLVGYWMPAWIVYVSVIIYSYFSHRLIQDFYRKLTPVLMDRPRFAFRTQEKALWLIALFCTLSLFNDMFFFGVAFILIVIVAQAILKPDAGVALKMQVTDRSDVREKGRRLKEAVATNRLYEDAELTLTGLAVKLSIHPHDLSRIINDGLNKNFSDFINEFRVREVARKMQDPTYDQLTLLGIAYESGFNSKTTFNRVFKEMTGKTPVEFKNSLRKKVPIDKLAPLPRILPVILRSEGRPTWASVKIKRNFMFRNYLKLAYRNIIRDKAYSIINISGLAIGLASSILILLWVQNEKSYDRFHKNASQIFRIDGELPNLKAAVNAQAMPAAVKAEIPAVVNTARLSIVQTALFESVGRKFEEKRVFYADPSFMDIFSFPLVQGDRRVALSRPDGILITQAMATKYFGNQEPLGKVLRKDNHDNLTVTGVLANTPANSDLQFDFILPMDGLLKNRNDDKWEDFNFYSYIQLAPNFDPSPANLTRLEKQMDQLFQRHSKMPVVFQLEPLTQIHLAPAVVGDLPGHGNMQYVNIFFITAILILIVACINFMNLATARSAKRAKEIGLRKVAGAIRRQLIIQFLTESVFIAFLCLVLAIGIVWLFLPVFNEIADKRLVIPFSAGWFWLSLLSIALLAGLVSGSYPALFLSGFNPVKVLKGNVRSMGGNLLFRNALVVTQFTASIILLVGTVVIYQQIKFIRDRNPGFEKANLLYIPSTGIWDNRQALKNELKQNPLTSDFAVTSDLPIDMKSGNMSANWGGKDPSLQIIYQLMDVDEDFIDVFKLKLLNGRSFSRSFPADSNNFIINERMAAVMGLTPKTAVGKALSFTQRNGTIVGVVKDFNFKPVQTAIEPLILRYNKNGGFIVLRTLPGKTAETITALSKISRQLNPGYPFEFNFVDQDMANLYKGEQQMSSIFNLFAALGIFISCLGLYGLSAFMAERRAKEIGVRKVLGASVLNLVSLLASGVTKLILIAVLIAIPISWFAVKSWLAGFAYHIEVGWLVFVIASFAALFIAWITVSCESLRAALANPVKRLRSE